jgi:hypothetical protein
MARLRGSQKEILTETRSDFLKRLGSGSVTHSVILMKTPLLTGKLRATRSDSQKLRATRSDSLKLRATRSDSLKLREKDLDSLKLREKDLDSLKDSQKAIPKHLEKLKAIHSGFHLDFLKVIPRHSGSNSAIRSDSPRENHSDFQMDSRKLKEKAMVTH